MIQIRAYAEGDEEGFQALDRLLEVHPWNRRNLDNWRWKYKGRNPAGEPIMYIGAVDGEMVAHFAAIPMMYWIQGNLVRASHSAAMMTKPEYQNRGLIKFVADKLFKELNHQGIPFTYGYPNENAYELHKKYLGYADIAMQPLFERNLAEISQVRKFAFPPAFVFREIDYFGEDINILWEELKNSFSVIVVRNDQFLNWRYIDRPDVPYYAFGAYDSDKLVGYCVLKLYREGNLLRGHFVDLFTVPGEQDYGRFLVQKGLEFFVEKRVRQVNLWMQGSAFLRSILEEYGFGVASERPLICRFNLEQEKYRTLLKANEWYFTMGDTLEIY